MQEPERSTTIHILSEQRETDKCGPLNTCGDIASPGACRSSCTTDASVSSCPGAGVFLLWDLADGVELTPQMALRVQGDVLGTIALARAGAGLAQTYQFAVARELARGELVEVLAHERGASRSFSLLYPRGVVQTPAVKKLVAFLVAEARRADVR